MWFIRKKEKQNFKGTFLKKENKEEKSTAPLMTSGGGGMLR